MTRIGIIETPTGWKDSEGNEHATAAAALAHARASSAARAADGGRDVTVVDWHPTTRIGRMVVKALQ